MIFALDTLDPTVSGILFLVSIVLFVLAAFNTAARWNLVALGLAFFAVTFCWNAFAAG